MRLAALSLPSLLNRCRTTLLAFVADEYLRGSMPFPRFGFLSLAISYLILELLQGSRRGIALHSSQVT